MSEPEQRQAAKHGVRTRSLTVLALLGIPFRVGLATTRAALLAGRWSAAPAIGILPSKLRSTLSSSSRRPAGSSRIPVFGCTPVRKEDAL